MKTLPSRTRSTSEGALAPLRTSVKSLSLRKDTKTSDDPRWMLVQRIVASQNLRRSSLLCNFLLFVCDRFLDGKSAEITEQQIAIQVFGRAKGFKGDGDNIVRSYARTLRNRIMDYFSCEGRNEPIVVVIPRGAYVPVFLPRSEAVESAAERAEVLWDPPLSEIEEAAPWCVRVESEGVLPTGLNGPESTFTATGRQSLEEEVADDSTLRANGSGSGEMAQPDATAISPTDANSTTASDLPLVESSASSRQPNLSRTKRRRPYRILLWFAATVFLVALLVAGAVGGYLEGNGTIYRWRHPDPREVTLNHIFWTYFFEDTRDTFVVPSDGSFAMAERLSRLSNPGSPEHNEGERDSTASTAKTQSIGMHPQAEAIGSSRYTTMADLNFIAALSRLKEVVPNRLRIRFSRDFSMGELTTGNAILLGSVDSNPWFDLFQPQLDFKFTRGSHSGLFVNQHPIAGEQLTYGTIPNDPLHHTYGLIAFAPNVYVLDHEHVLIVEGIDTAGAEAAETFLLNSDLMQPIFERAITDSGVIRPFEILIEADAGSRSHVICERIGRKKTPVPISVLAKQ